MTNYRDTVQSEQYDHPVREAGRRKLCFLMRCVDEVVRFTDHYISDEHRPKIRLKIYDLAIAIREAVDQEMRDSYIKEKSDERQDAV